MCLPLGRSTQARCLSVSILGWLGQSCTRLLLIVGIMDGYVGFRVVDTSYLDFPYLPHLGTCWLAYLPQEDASAMAAALVSLVVKHDGVARSPLSMLSSTISCHITFKAAAAATGPEQQEAAAPVQQAAVGPRAARLACQLMLRFLLAVPFSAMREATARQLLVEPLSELLGHGRWPGAVLAAAKPGSPERRMLHLLACPLGVIEWQRDWEQQQELEQRQAASAAAAGSHPGAVAPPAAPGAGVPAASAAEAFTGVKPTSDVVQPRDVEPAEVPAGAPATATGSSGAAAAPSGDAGTGSALGVAATAEHAGRCTFMNATG